MPAQTEKLIESLIDSNRQLQHSIEMTNQGLNTVSNSVDKIAQSVDKLVMMDAKREEREKIQVEKNRKYDAFIDKYQFSLNRLVGAFDSYDKHFDKVMGLIIIAILGLIGWNLK
jgi:hypothetical protein